MKNALIATVLFLLNIQVGFAHGENKLGPHSGYIRMPGAFHTELVSENEGAYSVYLMDVGNKNAVINNSSVALSHVDNKGVKSEFSCLPKKDHFSCKLSSKLSLKDGKILLKAKRNGAEGSVAEYSLPLSLDGVKKSSGHEAHNMH